eukprot:CAMPEP_0175987290 /NCGR_PEP_ID=MMETSP0108-20121206/50624_1 /TAXON_ID=195067 ORGANISM="Goniomonas pacifica, Strain CCMP1869" /NCGR_SAMPLE_ID=MMETSP0108 /ASSEMBLY_ACC=CAM_ASM_000204 /LENGTH=31 /DNA_ID= /DNA_START= /DNA_END= /DNA_ORIENTATION=
MADGDTTGGVREIERGAPISRTIRRADGAKQ